MMRCSSPSRSGRAGRSGLCALQGALFACAFSDRRIDVLGAILVGVAVALGGTRWPRAPRHPLGAPPVVIRGHWYVLVAVVAALLGMLLQRVLTRLQTWTLPLDALTLGLFGALGTSKALPLEVPAAPAVLIGTAAAVGGSVVRDLMLNLPVMLLHVGTLHAVAAAAGASLLVLLVAMGVSVPDAAIASVVLTTVIGLLAVHFGWRLAEQQALALRRRRSTAARRLE